MAETHIAAAVVLWHGARRVNEEILDNTAVQLATDNYAPNNKTTTTSEIVAQMRPKRRVDDRTVEKGMAEQLELALQARQPSAEAIALLCAALQESLY